MKWIIDPSSDESTVAVCSEDEQEHVCILQVDAEYPDLTYERCLARASQIVREHNAHYELIAACNKVLAAKHSDLNEALDLLAKSIQSRATASNRVTRRET